MDILIRYCPYSMVVSIILRKCVFGQCVLRHLPSSNSLFGRGINVYVNTYTMSCLPFINRLEFSRIFKVHGLILFYSFVFKFKNKT